MVVRKRRDKWGAGSPKLKNVWRSQTYQKIFLYFLRVSYSLVVEEVGSQLFLVS